ncbi:MAG: glycosyltransferase [Candidatus Glassbacteria bacterium]
MRILYLQEQPCIRTLKYAKGFKSYSSEIELYFAYTGKTLSEFYGHGDELFDGWFRIGKDTASSIKSIANELKPDLLHCHNGPDTLTVACIHYLGKEFPIVHDIHDLLSLRSTIYEDGLERREIDHGEICREEKIAIENSDGIITVSPAILEIAQKKYSPNSRLNLIFPNLVIGEMVPATLSDKLSQNDGQMHIVYEGHLDQKRSGGHYDLFDTFRVITEQGINIHIYPSQENELYRELARSSGLIHYHGSLKPDQLMGELTRYDYGWSGFNTTKNRLHADTVLPNKTIEYIAAGLPVISFPHRAQKRFIEENDVGIIIEDLSELSARLKSKAVKQMKRFVKEKRFDFTVENSIDRVYSFYQEIIGILLERESCVTEEPRR